MTNNPTEKALIARGFDSGLAFSLRRAGQTLDSLNRAEDPTLIALGLSQDQILIIRQEPRPPIPQVNLTKVLFASRWICCVCRNPDRPIVVHHIREWASSRDHSTQNLAVLCQEHHDEVHTTHRLSQNLTPARIVQLKMMWETEVIRKDALAIQQGSQLQAEIWFYFNHTRLFELALELGVDTSTLPCYPHVVNVGVCTQEGAIIAEAPSGSFMYANNPNRQSLYGYVHGMLKAVLNEATVRNISDYLDRGLVGCDFVPGDLVFVQGSHTFAPQKPAPTGLQLSKGVRRVNGVVVSFVFDLSEATSASAWSLWLRGRENIGSLLRVQRVQRLDGKLCVECTVLAIRSASTGLKERMYELKLYQSGIPQLREAAEEAAEAAIGNVNGVEGED